MKNLRVFLPLVDGGQLELDYNTGRELIHGMVSDDFGPPPHSLQLEATMEDGRRVRIGVPYNSSDKVFVAVELPDHD